MEKYIIFIGQKINNCYNINSPPTDVQSQCNLCQILTGFCVEIDKLIPRFTGKRKGSKVISTILKRERLTPPDFKTFIKLQQPTQSCIDIKIDKQINGIEKKIQTHTHTHIWTTDFAKAIQWREKVCVSNSARAIEYQHAGRRREGK